MAGNLIVLMTDFGFKDPYVGVMKGVIKSINPSAEIIDLTHEVRRQDVYQATIMLYVSTQYFPRNTIFVSVIDPGVGSSRRALLIKTRNYYFIGPDNGSLYPAASRDGIVSVYDISNSKFRLHRVSYTFHGRDIFAPIAAWLSLGIPPEVLGEKMPIESLAKITISEPKIDRDKIIGEAIYIDIFGNIMTNIKEDLITNKVKYGTELRIEIYDKLITCKYVPSFSYVNEGETACYINSWGYFEIAINKGNVAEKYDVKTRDKITISF
ncbi:MAG: S-adenosyl-l-methionine hydroxide adenosyltransferase family protein [Staphylothermus sp.]|nr:S-adenosyl-l-methionine hydroxide adenosyltransferase family protein [Staphylothermus sp.]